MSSAQNSLLELKIAAISHLQYEEYLILLGETMGNDMSRYFNVCRYQLYQTVASCYRKTVYDKVKEFLPQYARVRVCLEHLKVAQYCFMNQWVPTADKYTDTYVGDTL